MLDWSLGEDAEALRERLRALIKDEVPSSFRGALGNDCESNEVAEAFCRRLASEGLLTINWPALYGGGEADLWMQTVLREEMWAHHEPRGPQYMGLNWVGPVLMAYGTPEQRDLHLPLIAHGEVRWCQGFSEPGAGSDLASLSLSAKKVEDGTWRLSGQKIWTSYAGVADWCFLAARTGPKTPKHAGISIFLIPMDRDGVSVREVDSLMGKGHLNEVFFDDVVAQDDEILGAPGQGWEVIRSVLDFERVGIARYARSDRMLRDLWEHLLEEPELLAGELGIMHVRTLVHTRIARLLNYRTVARMEDETVVSGDAALARLASTGLDQEVAELAAEIVGDEALSNEPDAPLEGFVEDAWRYARASTIASGTTEIQQLLVARDAVAIGGGMR